MSGPRKPELTSQQRHLIEEARRLTAPETITAAAEYDCAHLDKRLLNSYAWAVIQQQLGIIRDLLEVIGELTGGAA